MLTKRNILLAVICIMIAACATGPPPTPRHAYARYLASWNDFMDSYRIHYDAQTSEVQAKWKEHVNPSLLKVSTALNAWGEDPSSYEKEQAFLTLKREAERLLIKYGIPQPQEVRQ